MEVNGVRSEPFTPTRSIRHGCPLSPMLYILALEPFLRKLKANPVLRGLTLAGASEVARYTAYPNHDNILKNSLKPLRSFKKKKIDNKDITNPYMFKNAPMLTTFVRLAGNRTKELWNFIDEASRADVMLANTKNAMLKKMLPFCSGRSRF